MKKVHKELETFRKEIESKEKTIACQSDQIIHLEKLNEIKQQQIDSIFQQLVQKQDIVNQVNERITRSKKETEKLRKDKIKLEELLGTRDTLETQNEILRHLEGLLIDGSQAPRLTTKMMNITENFIYPSMESSDRSKTVVVQGSSKKLNICENQDPSSLSVSNRHWD